MPPMKRRLTTTALGDTWAARAETLDPGIPRYTEMLEEVHYDRQGNLLAWRPTHHAVGGDPGFLASRRSIVLYTISPGGEVSSSSTPHTQINYRDPAGRSFRHVVYPLWAAGRGFASHVDVIEAISTDSDDGLIRVEATGRWRRPGRWTLTIDPEADYLVRSAAFRNQGKDRPCLRVETAGIRWFGPSVALAETGARFIGAAPATASAPHVRPPDVEYTLVGWKPSYNADMLSKLRQELRGPIPINARIYDHRAGAKAAPDDTEDERAKTLGKPAGVRRAGGGGSRQAREVRFPEDRALGALSTLDWESEGRYRPEAWESLGEARGTVRVPAGKELRLSVTEDALADLSPLSTLGPADLQSLRLPKENAYANKVDDAVLSHVAGLTGLRELSIGPSRISDAGLAHLKPLKSLRRLYLQRNKIGNEGLAHLSGLVSLEELFLHATNVTDAGMAHLESLPARRPGGDCGW